MTKRDQAPSKLGSLKRIYLQSKRLIGSGKELDAKQLLEKAILVYKLDETHP
jgi:hypothetical protein